MAIVNRDLDVSQQKVIMSFRSPSTAAAPVVTGVSLMIAQVSSPGNLVGINVSALGISGAPQLAFSIQRMAPSQTFISIGISNMVLGNIGTSGGAVGYSGIGPLGSTLLQLQARDVIFVSTAAANTSSDVLLIDLVMKKTQDILAVYGSSS